MYTGAPGADNENGPSTPLATQLEDPINRQALLLQSNVMAELADGTGGRFFHGNNDLPGGFHQLGSPPEYIYVLAFRPEILKKAGQYHRLKSCWPRTVAPRCRRAVAITKLRAPTLPKSCSPTNCNRRCFRAMKCTAYRLRSRRSTPGQRLRIAELLVTTRIDLSGVHFHKVSNANVDDLTLVCGLFDLNGNYLQGKEAEISLAAGGRRAPAANRRHERQNNV